MSLLRGYPFLAKLYKLTVLLINLRLNFVLLNLSNIFKLATCMNHLIGILLFLSSNSSEYQVTSEYLNISFSTNYFSKQSLACKIPYMESLLSFTAIHRATFFVPFRIFVAFNATGSLRKS